MVTAKHLSRPSEARDDFIHNEQGIHFTRNVLHAREKLWWRHDVSCRALYGLDNDCRNTPSGIVFDALAHELQAQQPTVRITDLKGAPVAIRVRDQMGVPGQRPPPLFGLITNQAQHAASLAVKSTPEANHLMLFGIRPRQAQRRFHRLGPTTVKLGLLEVSGCTKSDELDERAAIFCGKTPDHQFAQLRFQRGDEPGMGMPKAGNCHAGIKVEIAITIDIEELRASPMGHRQT